MPPEPKPSFLALRLPPSPMTGRLVGVGAMGLIVIVWWLATSGAGSEDRLISPVLLPSPVEVVRSFPSLLNDRALLQSIAATLKRVLVGFGLSVSSPDRGGSWSPPARRLRCSGATCPSPR